MDYRILKEAYIDRLESRVNQYLEKGYVLVGGIAIDSDDLYYQAVVKYK